MLRSFKLGSSSLLDASTLLLLLAAAAPTAIAASQRRAANQQATLLSFAATTPQHSSSLAHSLTSCASFIEETAAGIIRQQQWHLCSSVCACSFCGCFLFRPALPINLGNFDHATGGIASNGSLSPWVTFAFLPWCFILRLFLPPGCISTRDFRNLSAQIVNNVVCFFVCLSVSTGSRAGSSKLPGAKGRVENWSCNGSLHDRRRWRME